MKELSSEESLDYDVPKMLQTMLDLAVTTGEAMFETELIKKNAQAYEEAQDREKEFKALLRQLYFWYKPKFEQADGAVELSENLDEKLENAQDVWELSWDESTELFRTIRQLMEQIGHTKFETEDHSDAGVGGGS
jgi:hypothetical protein